MADVQANSGVIFHTELQMGTAFGRPNALENWHVSSAQRRKARVNNLR